MVTSFDSFFMTDDENDDENEDKKKKTTKNNIEISLILRFSLPSIKNKHL